MQEYINNKQIPWTLNGIFEHPHGCHFVNFSPRRILCSSGVRFFDRTFQRFLLQKQNCLQKCSGQYSFLGLSVDDRKGWWYESSFKWLVMTCVFLCFPLALDVARAFGMAILMMDFRKGVNHGEPRRSRYTAAYTGAGISTAAGIKDCRCFTAEVVDRLM